MWRLLCRSPWNLARGVAALALALAPGLVALHWSQPPQPPQQAMHSSGSVHRAVCW